MYVAPSAATPACSRLRHHQGQEWEIVRIIGLDAPEIEGGCASERELAVAARDRLADLLAGRPVRIRRTGCDRYQRTLATVTVDGRDVAEVLIFEGLARPYAGGHRRSWCGKQ